MKMVNLRKITSEEVFPPRTSGYFFALLLLKLASVAVNRKLLG